MRTALLELRDIERYLLRSMSTGERLVFQARMIVSEELRENVRLQKKTLRLLRLVGREALRDQLDALHEQLMQDPGFAQRVTGNAPLG